MDFASAESVTLFFIFVFCLSYLSGSVPYGLILTKAFNLGDIRKIGSGNIGATNVLRTGNKKIAAATLLLDALKGFLPVFIFNQFGDSYAAIASIAAILGHCYPVWLKFKGGKGVATALGVLFGLNPFIALAAMGTWVLSAFITRISSLSALIACASTPFFALLFAQGITALTCLVLSILICLRHEANIKRILNKTESKIGEKK